MGVWAYLHKKVILLSVPLGTIQKLLSLRNVCNSEKVAKLPFARCGYSDCHRVGEGNQFSQRELFDDIFWVEKLFHPSYLLPA